MDAAISSAYAQLLSVGVLWVSLHCAGMCGPLVLGLGLGRGAPSGPRWLPWAQVGAYQLGKAGVYALLGALAGLLGKVVAEALERVGPLLAGGLGLLLLVGTVVHNLSGGAASSAPARLLAPLLARVQRASLRPLRRALLLGVAMSALPCMLVVWVLTLAASTASPLHGALVMVLLVVLNSVPLLLTSRLPSLLGGRRGVLSRVQPWLGAVSGAWLLLVAVAAAGLVPHASLGFKLAGRGFVVMFW